MKYVFSLFIACFILTSCEKGVTFDLDESSPKLVVEATIETNQPPIVILTKSQNFFDQITPDILVGSFVRHAEVYVSNGTLTHKLKEDSIHIANSYYFYFYSKWKIVLFIKSKIEGLKEGALSVFKMEDKWPFLIYTLLIWISYVLMFYATTFALKETETITLGTTLVAFVIGSLIIAFTNGGFGFFPIIIAKIFFLYGIPLEAGNAFGWIAWTSQLAITIVLGIFAFSVLPLVRKKQVL